MAIRRVGPTDDGGDTVTADLRVVTLNVLASGYADWERRRAVIAGGLAELRPDVVALQEVATGPDRDEVADLLGRGYHVARHSRTMSDGTGAALACRWPFGEIHELDLGLTPRALDCPWIGTLVAEVLAPPPLGPLLVVHHKPNWQLDYEREREEQAVAATRFVEDLLAGRERHVVLLGDLDAGPDTASIRFLTGRQSLDGLSVCYHDAWESAHPDEAGPTFTAENPLVRDGDMPLGHARRIDHVMVRGTRHGPTLLVRACDRIFTEPVGGVRASDHYGVLADLALPSRPPGDFAF
jgi:endonuclease/exonuclease/phosphatase family metal-dependent hydrolase